MKTNIPWFGAALLLASFVSVTEAQTPIIQTQPTNETVLAGGTASFSVAVSGTGPFTYQWLFNGTNLMDSIISTVAGNGGQGYSGDGGTAIDAELNLPTGVAVDKSGNLFIADTENEVVRKVDTNSIISTVVKAYTLSQIQIYPLDFYPTDVAVDNSGNLFIAVGSEDCIFKLAANGSISTVAGKFDVRGYAGDGGSAIRAYLHDPLSVVVDKSGNLFIADTENEVVRKVGINGIISTVAGNGTAGYLGDGIEATNAELSFPSSVAADNFGNLFIADLSNNRIRMVATNGIISTLAGTGVKGYSGDGGLATSAELDGPWKVLVDTTGNVFFSDSGNQCIRKVGTNGIINTLAGNGLPGYSGDGGLATSVELAIPQGVAVDNSGNLFFSDSGNNRIREVGLPNVPILTLSNVTAANAGSYSVIISNTYGNVTSAVAVLTVDSPPTITFQPQSLLTLNGNSASFSVSAIGPQSFFYQWQQNGTNLTDDGNIFGSSSNILTLIAAGTTNAGNYDVILTNAFGTVTSTIAVLDVASIAIQPTNQAVLGGSNATFNLSVTGTGPFTFRWLFNGTNLGIISTVAGNIWAGSLGDGGPAIDAEFNLPDGVAVDRSSNLFIADSGNNRIREVGTNGIISTVAGNGSQGYSGDGHAATNAWMFYPQGVAADNFGNVFIADLNNNRIREVTTNGIIATVAGTGNKGFSGDGVAAINAGLDGPEGVTVDASGNLFIADTGNNRIRRVATNGIINTVAGTGGAGYSVVGGVAVNSEFDAPAGSAVDNLGNLFIADTGNNRIRKVMASGIVSTVAGNGAHGYSGDGGAAINAELQYPRSVALDNSGNLFIADTSNRRIREVTTNGVIATVAGTGSQGFSGDGGAAINAGLYNPTGVAVDASGNLFISDSLRVREVTWADGPTVTVSNVSSANAGDYSVIVSSPYGSVTSSAVTLTVPLPPAIVTEPQGQPVILGSNATLSVTVTGTAPLSYQWQFDGTNLSDNSQITGSESNVLTIANFTMGNSGTYQIIVSNAYGSTNAVATLTVSQATPIIMWTNPAPIMYGAALTASQLDATASVPGTFNYTPTNGTVPYSGTNTLSVIFTPTDTVDYSSATDTVSLVVSLAPLTVTAFNANRPYGAANPVFTGTITGLTNGDNFTATYGTTATASSPPGIYPILPTLVDPTDLETNYIVSFIDGTLTVGQATPILTWTNPAPVIYGTALSTNQLNATANVPGALAYTPTNSTVLYAGTNTLSVIFAPTDTVDYSGATDTVSLVVMPAPLTVTAADASRAYGQTNPVFTGIVSGLTNGDNITANYDCSATTNSPVGSYAIVPILVDPANLETNYAVTLTDGTLTVTVTAAGPQISIQPTNQSVVLGSNASFSVGAIGGAPLVYQWQFDSTNLATATNTDLMFSAVASTNAGSYDVVITNSFGSVTSAIVTLSVLGVAPSFVTSPGAIQFTNGQLQLSLSGLTGQGSVLIEASSNLTQWTPVFTNPPGFGTIQFTDPTTTNYRSRYYRVTTPGP